MRPLLLAAVTATALLAGACVTAGGLPERTTAIITTPAGARVFINGAEVCPTTPCDWNEGDGLAQRYHLQVRKEGYREIDFYLDKELRFFSGFLSVLAFRMPRQILLTLEAPGGAPPPPAEAPPAPGTTPSL